MTSEKLTPNNTEFPRIKAPDFSVKKGEPLYDEMDKLFNDFRASISQDKNCKEENIRQYLKLNDNPPISSMHDISFKRGRKIWGFSYYSKDPVSTGVSFPGISALNVLRVMGDEENIVFEEVNVQLVHFRTPQIRVTYSNYTRERGIYGQGLESAMVIGFNKEQHQTYNDKYTIFQSNAILEDFRNGG